MLTVRDGLGSWTNTKVSGNNLLPLYTPPPTPKDLLLIKRAEAARKMQGKVWAVRTFPDSPVRLVTSLDTKDGFSFVYGRRASIPNSTWVYAR